MPILRTLFTVVLLSLPGLSAAQDSAPQDPEALQVFFETGQSAIASDQVETLDQAARVFREGNPYVMIVTGGADTVGDPGNNLDLSLARARSVAQELQDRGIPIARLQILGRGNTELPVETGPNEAERRNRVAEITWRVE